MKEQDNSFDEKLTLINTLVKERVTDSFTNEDELNKKMSETTIEMPIWY